MTIPGEGFKPLILAHLAKHPGADARQMADALGKSRKSLSGTLAKLTHSGELERTANGPPHPISGKPMLRFFITGSVPDTPEVAPVDQRVTAPEASTEAAAPELRTWADKVMDFIREHPGKTNIEIAEAIGYGRENVSSCTVGLWRKGYTVRTEGPMSAAGARGRRMQPRHYVKGQSPAGVPLIEVTQPVPRATTVDKYNAAIRELQEAEQEAKEDASIARYESEQEELEPEAPITKDALKVKESLPLPAVAPPLAQGFESALEHAAAILADRIVMLALQGIEARLNQHLPAPSAPKDYEGIGAFYERRATDEKNGKPTALVVGLLPQQQALMQSDFHHKLKLSFWKDGSLKLLQQKAESVEHVLLVCDFIGHDTSGALSKHKAKTVLVRGGMHAVRDALGAIAAGA